MAGSWGEGIFSSVDGNNWVYKNSGLTNLYITDIKVTSGNIYFATTYGGGVFKSTDNGSTWTALNNGIDNLNLKCVLPYSNDTLFVGSYGSGIYRSINGGTSWQKANKGISYQDINCLARTKAGAVFAGTYGGGIFMTGDRGTNWRGFSGIASNYINSFGVFANGDVAACTNGRGVYFTDNEGKSWLELAYALDSRLEDQNVTCFIDIKTNNHTYVVGTKHRGVYTYKTVSDDFYEQSTNYKNMGSNVMAMTSQKILYMASPQKGIMRSTTNGVTWLAIDNPITKYNGFAMKIWSDNNSNLLFSGRRDGGLYMSSNFGNTWSDNKIVGRKVQDLIITNTGTILAEAVLNDTTYDGIMRSTNGGVSFTMFGTKDTINKFGKAFNGDLFALTVRTNGSGSTTTITARIKKSVNDGATWNESLFFRPFCPTCRSWLFGQANGDLFISLDVSPPKIFVSSNGGDNVVQKTFTTALTVRDMTMTPNGNLWMATNDGIWKSVNNGNNFTTIPMNFAMPKTKVIALGGALAFRSDNEVFVGMEADGIYRTLNGGTTFDTLNYNVTVADFNGSTQNKDGDIFLSTNSLYRNTNPASMGIVSLVSPADNTYAVNLSPSTTWTTAAKADLYEMQITQADDFNFVQYRYVLKDTNVTIFDTLQYNSTYYWRTRGKNFGSYSNWSNVRSFTTKLMPPVQSAPKDSACGVKIMSPLAWRRVSGADNYTYEISTSKSFTTIAATGGVINPMDTFAISGKLEPLTIYYWRVKASNTLTNESDWSAVKMFKTAVDFPKQKFPANKAIKQDVDITFRWDTVVEGTKYNIQIAKDSAMTEVLYGGAASGSDTHDFIDFEYNTKIWWRLQGGNECGLGEWSPSWSFNTSVQAPRKAYPDSSKINTEINPLFRWSAVKGATSYRLQVSEDANFTNLTYDSAGIANAEIDIKKQLKDFTNYYWRSSTKLGTNESDFNSVWTFRTWVDTVSLVSPIDKAENQAEQLILRWTKPSGVDTFHLQVATDFNFNNKFIDEDKITFNQKDYIFTAGTNYFWRVEGKEKAAGYRAWSPVWTFKIATNSVALDELKQSIKVMPNPIGNKLSIEFNMPTLAKVDVRLLDISGRELATIINEKQMEGTQRLDWNAEQLAAGTYYLQFLVDGEIFVKEIQKLK